jgi:hypothetical protein
MNSCDLQEAKHVALVEFRNRLKYKNWRRNPDCSRFTNGPFEFDVAFYSDNASARIHTKKGWEYIDITPDDTRYLLLWAKQARADMDKARAERQCKAIMKALRPWWKFW